MSLEDAMELLRTGKSRGMYCKSLGNETVLMYRMMAGLDFFFLSPYQGDGELLDDESLKKLPQKGWSNNVHP